jgi:hypothetical protein
MRPAPARHPLSRVAATVVVLLVALSGCSFSTPDGTAPSQAGEFTWATITSVASTMTRTRPALTTLPFTVVER